MATPTQIEQGFRTAGFIKGRPTVDNAPDPVFPNNYPLLIDLFDDDTIRCIQLELGEPPDRLRNTTDIVGWKYFFAARVLETIIEAGLTVDGRPLDITSVDTGGYGTNYVNASEYIEIVNNRVSELRIKGRKLGGEISAMADVTVLTEVQTGDTLVGNGTSRSKLDVKIPYTEGERNKLAGIEPGATAGGGAELTQESVYEEAEKIIQAGSNITVRPNDSNNTITISSTATGSGGLNFADLRDSIVAGEGTRIVVDNEKELINIGALEQNGRWISIGRIDFPTTDILDTVKFFNTNIPFDATDQDKNIIKIFLTNTTTLDSQGAEEAEFIVGLLQTTDSGQATRRIAASRTSAQNIRIWRTSYTPPGTTDKFVRINIRRLKRDNNQFYWGFLTFAPEETTIPGLADDGVIELGGLTAVRSDSSLDGDGTRDNILKVAEPYTAAERTKLAALSVNSDGAAALQLARSNQLKVEDLRAGPPTTGWADATNAAAGGLALRTGDPFTLAQAQSAGYSVSPASPGGKFFVVRLAQPSMPAQARIILQTPDSPPLTFTEQITSLHALGADSNFTYWYSRLSFGDHVSTAKLQLTGSAAHVGASKYRGELTGSLRDGIVTSGTIVNKAISLDKLADAVAARLLPSSLGTAGQVLTVNSAASAVEYATPSAGGGTTSGGGGWESVGTGNIAARNGVVTSDTFSDKTLFMILARRQGTSEFGRGPLILPVNQIPTSSSGLIQSIFYAGANFYGIRLVRRNSGSNRTITITGIQSRAVYPVNLFLYAQ